MDDWEFAVKKLREVLLTAVKQPSQKTAVVRLIEHLELSEPPTRTKENLNG